MTTPSNSNPREIAVNFSDGLLAFLQALAAADDETAERLDRFCLAVESAALDPNPIRCHGFEPTALWPDLFPDQGAWRDDPLLSSIYASIPFCSWFRAETFYPQAEHRHFSERVWGATVAGQEDAVFHSGDRYIALLILIEPNTTYPLHSHRIAEDYLVLAGEAEWSHDGEDWIRTGPGGSFHNRSWQAHTMRTGSEPMMSLGLYLPPFGWEGGLL